MSKLKGFDLSYFNLWLTGLSGSGKTTIVEKVSDCLTDISINNEVLDGDVYRAFLSPGTGYSEKERNAFRKKVIVLAGIFNKHDVSCIIAMLSSSQSVRRLARQELSNFVEVYVKCPIEVCIARDPKGIYQKRKKGEMTSVVGIDIPYEEPISPEIIIETDKISIDSTSEIILDKLKSLHLLKEHFLKK